MDSSHNLSNPSLHSFPAYHPSASVSTPQSCHEVELLTSNLQDLTFQEANSTTPPPALGNQCFNFTRPPHLPLPPQLEQVLSNHLQQIHGGGLEYFDSPMLQNFMEKLIQESLRLVSQGTGAADEA